MLHKAAASEILRHVSFVMDSPFEINTQQQQLATAFPELSIHPQGMIKGKAPFLRLQTRTKTQLQSVCQAAMSTNNISFSQVMKLTYPMLVPKLATTTII
ncbi:hypothetical protein HanXRQr2_Chr12g0547711 [Helianthus annuus]|uniref:Uncharacterized protein n=1 Tax=Helianthus annuus TaxID=4232 RepID=A0A9K3HHH6_HELAN|nr:hypothetical protein HanXRQr2_Chr12g0547711 [Helianthus annuus]KAJ0863202.1 hypothetical protein HanPSC8_Chr12g0527191 [Helianthus annuus]